MHICDQDILGNKEQQDIEKEQAWVLDRPIESSGGIITF